MKKLKFIATMTVEFEVDDDYEKEIYPDGLNKLALEKEMRSDTFHEIFEGELQSYNVEGFVISGEKVLVRHKEIYGDKN